MSKDMRSIFIVGGNTMNRYYYVFKDQEKASKFIADFTVCMAERCSSMTLGTATGSTFEGVYKNLAKQAEKLEPIRYIRQMDNYYQGPTCAKDGRTGYEQEIWDAIAKYIPGVDFDIPKEFAWDEYAEAIRYEASRGMAAQYSTMWLQYVGIGGDGHIAFNEPGDDMYAGVHPVILAEQTVLDNARFFNGSTADVPKKAITSGMADILGQSDIIVCAAFGEKKAKIVTKAVSEAVDVKNPATLLQLFAGSLIYIFDEEAGKVLDGESCDLSDLSPEELADEIINSLG